MTAATAVLNTRRLPMSSSTLARVWCAMRRRSRSAPASWLSPSAAAFADIAPVLALAATCSCTAFHRRRRNRFAPSTPSSDHSSDCSGGAVNIMNRRAVSAPIFFRQRIRVDAVAARLGHGAQAFIGHGAAIPAQRGMRFARGRIDDQVHVGRIEIFAPAAGRRAVEDVVEHHALRQQVGERLRRLHQPHVMHDARPEPRIEQVQDGVLDAADVLIHLQPVVGARVDHGLVVAKAGEAQEIPGRIHEGVHGVGFAPRIGAALRALALVERRRLRQRIAAAIRHQVLRQAHRQVLVGHRHIAALRRSG